ncbi:MAG: ribosome assembly RNA-binding protein YhbY [Gammaproteobacteria bacterium]|jgi:RNA-binding protein
MPLSKRQEKYLRTLAHDKKPVIWLGQHGLTDQVLAEIESALKQHELIKIKVRVGEREERDRIISEICRQTTSENVQKIGNTITIFRRNTEKPRIPLPA